MSQSREEAITEYQRQIGRILNCVSHAWAYSFPVKGAPDSNEYMLVSQDRNVSATSSMLRMSRGKERLFLEASQRFKIFEDNGFRISTLKYNYVIWSSKTDERIIDWHYHRRHNRSFQAHLHIRDDAKATSHNLVNRHIPTGRVPLEDIVRFAIEELNVDSREAKWKEILEDTEKTFMANKTW